MVAVMRIGGVPTQADFHEAISARSDRWYSACLKITRNPDMAADAVQDALLNAWNKRHQFEQSARLDTWIHRIAINAALNQIRKSKPGVFEPLESDIESNLAAPQRILEEHELENDLARSLARLSEVERVCFILKHLEQWRVKEISAELNLNEGRIKQAVFRAVKKLRVSMQDMQREDDERR
jgi:RNA polymerase sigma-70 factor (ECF subfamily)